MTHATRTSKLLFLCCSLLSGQTITNPYANTRSNWYCGGTHAHGTVTGGDQTPAQIFADAATKGYKWVGLTDKNVITSDPGSHSGITFFPGYEDTADSVTTAHMTCTGCTTQSTIADRQASINYMNSQAGSTGSGVFISLAHPTYQNISGVNAWSDARIAAVTGYDAIEIFSGQGFYGLTEWDNLLYAGTRKWGIGVFDSYNSGAMHPVTCVAANTNDATSIFSGLKEGNFYVAEAQFGIVGAMRVSVSGNVITASTRVSETDATGLTKKFYFIGGDTAAGHVLKTVASATSATYTVTGSEKYVRVCANNTSATTCGQAGYANIYSQPIFVTPAAITGASGLRFAGNVSFRGATNIGIIAPAVYSMPVPTSLSGPTGCIAVTGFTDPATCNITTDTFSKTTGTAYTDYTHGGHVTIQTDPGHVHSYATPNPLSATNKYLLTVNLVGGVFTIRNVATRAVVHDSPCGESGWWDPDDDEKLYCTSSTGILRHDVLTNTTTTIHDYTGTFTDIRRGGTGDSSKDNWIPFWDPVATKVCAYAVTSDQTYCANYSGDNPPSIDFVLISKGVDAVSGKRYVIVAGGPANLVYTVNTSTVALDFYFRGPLLPNDSPGRRWWSSHADTLEANGIQYVVQNNYIEDANPGNYNTVLFRLNKGTDITTKESLGGGYREVFTMFLRSNFGQDDYASCAKKTAYCVVYTPSFLVSSGSTPGRTPHGGDIVLITGAGSAVTRITQDHNIRYDDLGDNFSYYGMSRPSISNDGTRVVFDSDYQQYTDLPRANIVLTGVN